jgi:hypothetical protein
MSATEHKKRPGVSASMRFKVQRERGSDWCVIDTRSNNIPIVTGLDIEEAQQTADARNKKRWSKKECFKEFIKTAREGGK